MDIFLEHFFFVYSVFFLLIHTHRDRRTHTSLFPLSSLHSIRESPRVLLLLGCDVHFPAFSSSFLSFGSSSEYGHGRLKTGAARRGEAWGVCVCREKVCVESVDVDVDI